MYLEWKFNHEAEGTTLKEFEKEFESIYGFIMLKLGNFQLGYIDKTSSLYEGDEDISYYIIKLIECGIVLSFGQEFKLNLLSSNLLEIQVQYFINVCIKVIHIETKEVLCHHNITFDELTEIIKNNYVKYINEVKKMNSTLLKSKTVRRTELLYDFFMKYSATAGLHSY